MARILVVTGRMAEDIVRKTIAYSKTKHCVNVVVTPIPVAAFLTTEYIALYLKELGVSSRDYDYILLPGLVRGSGRIIEEAIGVRTVKGTVNVYDLTDILRLDDLSILSPDKPADEILQNVVFSNVRRVLMEIEDSLSDSNSIVVRGLRIPVSPPPIRVVAEVAEAHTLTVDSLIRECLRLVESGADIISLSFETYSPHPDAVKRIVSLVRRELDTPIAIDTSIPSEVNVAIESGVDMVINVDLTNIDRIERVNRDVAIVTTPRDPNTAMAPSDVDERVFLLKKAVEAVRARGFEKVFADAILDIPLSTFRSLLAFYRFKLLYPDIPMFMGVGNVTEMVDVDSVGVNALLTMFAREVGASLILTVEKSVKARGSTLECKLASQMTSLADVKGCPPKDIGLSLLILKDKRRYDEPLDKANEVIEAVEEERPYMPDPMGVFKIRVDHENGYIEVLYIGRKGRILIRGRSARAIRHEIVSRELISQVSHALYIGQELAKAEIALRLGKNYIQEAPLFKIPQLIKLDRGVDT